MQITLDKKTVDMVRPYAKRRELTIKDAILKLIPVGVSRAEALHEYNSKTRKPKAAKKKAKVKAKPKKAAKPKTAKKRSPKPKTEAAPEAVAAE